MLKLTATDYRTLYDIVFRDDYPGYRPNVIESPNGDGVKDSQKRYAHVSSKYIRSMRGDSWADGKGTYWYHPYQPTLTKYLQQCHEAALDVAVQLGVPREFWPDIRYSALRVLEYPPGAGSAEHTDFDLFTLNLYRNNLNAGLGDVDFHKGEILTEISKYHTAAKHYVNPHRDCQYSLVYFAMPSEAAVLPSGQTVGAWVEERKKRSRYDA